MATGIVAVALELQGARALARALTVIGATAYLVLWLLTGARVARFPRAVLRDLSDHGRGVGFFTAVAATGVLGSQLVVILGARRWALGLWWLAVVLWLGLTYAVFTALVVKERKPTLAEGIHGGWLLAVVATQAVANLGALLLPSLGAGAEPMAFVAVTVWLAGGMLYVWIISLIFYRYTFFTLQPSDLMPPYWINMGAMAISTLAGALLVEHGRETPFLAELIPFLQGFTLLFWATATWWIPMLGILGYWRHVTRGVALRYDPLYWGAVFPLGMYTVCTIQLARVMNLPFLLWIPHVSVYIALAAWSLASLGLLRRLWRFAKA